MTSRFVSGGTNEEPNERDEAWLKAQQEIEAKRQQRTEVGKQEDGKSLYETLQANKAAKQEAFEESIRLKNQFRSLDEDEVDFLDSMLESTRAKEAEVKKQTKEQLDAFKLAQQEAEKLASQDGAPNAPDTTEAWTAGSRKRRKGRETTIGGVKLRRTSTSDRQPARSTTEALDEQEKPVEESTAEVPEIPGKSEPVAETSKATITPKATDQDVSASKPPPAPPAGLGLAAYSSDEDE